MVRAQADAYMKAGNTLHTSAHVPSMPDFAPTELPPELPPSASADLGEHAPAPQARGVRQTRNVLGFRVVICLWVGWLRLSWASARLHPMQV